MESVLACRELRVEVPGRVLVAGLDLALARGRFLAVLGQNGSGKTLTLHTLAGLRPPAAGTVWLEGRSLAALGRRTVAQRLALLPQSADDAFPATVLDTALSGRHPHVPPLAWESRRDRDIAAGCLERVGLSALARRDVRTLSGGERRRLAIAQVLAQAPSVYLLDEPTNHLDPQHQLEVLDLFRGLVDDGRTVVASLHDVNLAARYATHCLLLYGDGRARHGPTADILDGPALSELYGTTMEPLAWRGRTLFVAAGAAASGDGAGQPLQ